MHFHPTAYQLEEILLTLYSTKYLYIFPNSVLIVSEIELSKQIVPINKIPKDSSAWVICVLIIHMGSVIPYNNPRHVGTFQRILLVDDDINYLHFYTVFLTHLY